jgi:transketolase
VITVEDHYAHGGDAVLSALAEEPLSVYKLVVREIPRSGKPHELMDRYGISARTSQILRETCCNSRPGKFGHRSRNFALFAERSG